MDAAGKSGPLLVIEKDLEEGTKSNLGNDQKKKRRRKNKEQSGRRVGEGNDVLRLKIKTSHLNKVLGALYNTSYMLSTQTFKMAFKH